eukprot:TRINITY_DN15962_c0_g1_i4.p1 TRINITY_DN15962_c0_g1~~TRINITY_DN15962_c0_g1_i4.p1  ORF type:complete len:402 (+),score=148.65 TRINITY_DN15962_c0_g1_i4:75-1208(+)
MFRGGARTLLRSASLRRALGVGVVGVGVGVCNNILKKRDTSTGYSPEADGFDLSKLSGRDNQVLTFLYDKEVMKDQEQGVRKIKFTNLLKSDTDQYKAAKERVLHLLEPEGDKHDERTPEDIQTLEEFCQAVPEWNDPEKSYVVFRDRDCWKGKHSIVRQRVQRSGLCYIHAPVVFQHYLVAMTQPEVGMINIAKMVRDGAPDEFNFTRHIFENGGGDSKVMLKCLCGDEDPELVGCDAKAFRVGLVDPLVLLKEHGPALVSAFEVREDFAKGAIKLEGKPQGQLIGLHAMVLVGVRTGDDGRRFYLVQNWWPRQQFVQFDEEYLASSSATLSFSTKPPKHIPMRFPQLDDYYAECEGVDKEEQCNGEYPVCPAMPH